jgi:uncharacterized membrane protein YfcA
VRITKTSHKVVFIVGGWLIGYVITTLVGRFVPHTAATIIGTLLTLLQIAIAVRIFRGSNEDMARPRAWWRATSRPRAGYVVGGISAFGALGILPQLFQSQDLPPDIIATIGAALLATYFLHSSIKLTNEPSSNDELSNVHHPTP